MRGGGARRRTLDVTGHIAETSAALIGCTGAAAPASRIRCGGGRNRARASRAAQHADAREPVRARRRVAGDPA
ncbi:hypothetical protein C7296_12155, partial [Burkholderia thailandensis]|nr:hypothetical protein [Burkholderia thailandensis]